MHRILPLLLFTLLIGACGGDREGQSQTGASAPGDSVVIPVLTKDDFEAHLAQGGISFLEFGGKSCKPCREMQPILRRLKAEHPDIRVAQIYNEDAPELLEQWSIQLIPTQVVLGPDRREITRHVGLWEYDEILSELRSKGVLQ